jgi:hypothetical protein
LVGGDGGGRVDSKSDRLIVVSGDGGGRVVGGDVGGRVSSRVDLRGSALVE